MEQNFNPTKARILQYIDFRGITRKEFCEKIDVNPSNLGVSNLNSAFNSDILNKILREYNEISALWLITGEGEMLAKNDNNSSNSEKNERISDLKCHIETLTKEVDMQKDYINTLKEQIRELKNAVESLPVAAEIRKQYK
jgi:predicted nuclease with TOPRIM domain